MHAKFIFPRVLVVLLALTFAVTRAAAAPDAGSPAAVVQALYHTSLEHFSGFTSDSVKLTKPWVDPDLYKRLWKKVNEPQPKDAAPDIEGDIFLDCQEPPARFEVGPSSINGSKATVVVTLYFSGETRHYTAQLQQVGGAWKISNVDFGKDGKLTDLL